jgi:elongation factor Ts
MVTAETVRELRERTGAGMMDCKKALTEASGDLDKAVEWLRKKGLSAASKKAGRVAAEGLVSSYIHSEGRIGVLVEVNCETDFVALNTQFKDLVKDLSMHIAAVNPLCVRSEELDPKLEAKEREILMDKAKESGKKPEFLQKIVDGQITKWKSEICLLEQKFVKNPDITVQQMITQAIATIGENIVVRRFARFELGEGIEKKTSNLAEEVAAALKG